MRMVSNVFDGYGNEIQRWESEPDAGAPYAPTIELRIKVSKRSPTRDEAQIGAWYWASVGIVQFEAQAGG